MTSALQAKLARSYEQVVWAEADNGLQSTDRFFGGEIGCKAAEEDPKPQDPGPRTQGPRPSKERRRRSAAVVGAAAKSLGGAGRWVPAPLAAVVLGRNLTEGPTTAARRTTTDLAVARAACEEYCGPIAKQAGRHLFFFSRLCCCRGQPEPTSSCLACQSSGALYYSVCLIFFVAGFAFQPILLMLSIIIATNPPKALADVSPIPHSDAYSARNTATTRPIRQYYELIDPFVMPTGS